LIWEVFSAAVVILSLLLRLFGDMTALMPKPCLPEPAQIILLFLSLTACYLSLTDELRIFALN
jgi:hypothetical protein